jgi:DNA-directed RNA polymerase subunit RPC12/RpoP
MLGASAMESISSTPRPRTCQRCGQTREDVAEVSYYVTRGQKTLQLLCSECKARILVRRRRHSTRRSLARVSRGNRAVETIGLSLVIAGAIALAVVIVGALVTRLF